MLSKRYSELRNSPDIGEFILNEYGIKADVIFYNGNPTIKVFHHYSLFEIIKKVRLNFDFTVHHKHQKNEYIITLLEKYDKF